MVPIRKGAIRITSMRVLGVVVSGNLIMGYHLDEIHSSSASSIYAIHMLRTHGLGRPQLFEVARSTPWRYMMLYAYPPDGGLPPSAEQVPIFI